MFRSQPDQFVQPDIIVKWVVGFVSVLFLVGSFGCKGQSWTEKERSELRQFTASLGENAQARELLYRGPDPIAPEKVAISREDSNRIVVHMKAALTLSDHVSDNVLDKLHPELKFHYRQEFQAGVRAQLQGIEADDVRKQLQGQMLMDKWLDFVKPHVHEFNKAIDR